MKTPKQQPCLRNKILFEVSVMSLGRGHIQGLAVVLLTREEGEVA